jgi:hypothetical protein
MNLDEQIRDDLRHTPFPAALAPPTDLADTVLRRLHRRRRARTLLGTAAAVTAAVAVVAIGVPSARPDQGGGTGADITEPAFPAPGGGPQAVHVYTTNDRTYLLDVDAGQYRAVPFSRVVLSPDLTLAAVTTGERVGLANRAALLRDGAPAVRWLDLPPGNGLAWSPDGTALLWTSIAKGTRVRFTAHRYDVASRKTADTPINVDILGSSVGWAGDSKSYLALLRGHESSGGVEPGALQYIRADGSLGRRLETAGGMTSGAQAYSPSRRYLATDTSDLMAARPLPSPILDTTTGKVVASLTPGSKPVGWYDETTVLRLAPGGDRSPVLELVSIPSGTVTRSIDLSGEVQATGLQTGSSAGLTGRAAAFGF